MNSASVASDIAEAARAHHGRDAIRWANGAIRYGQLDGLSAEFADQLESRTAPGEFVGVEAVRAPSSVIAMVGALRARRPFVFLDPRDGVSNQAKAALLGIGVTARPGESGAPRLEPVPLRWRGEGVRMPGPVQPPGDDIAYAIYTSGSTGEPKCVLVRARPLIRLIRDHVHRLDLEPSSRTLQFARLTFDGCITEILWTLTSGACLVILDEARLGPGAALRSTLERYRITHLKTTPFALTATEPSAAMSLRHVVNGGGACRPAVLRKWSSVAAFHNAYGTTETTVCNLLSDPLAPEDCTEAVPLGDPVGEGVIRIEPVAGSDTVGPVARGELVSTGDCVAAGYLTADGLVPFIDERGRPVYRTGDLVERRDGRLYYVERLDRQLKVRGYRLDPGEVENAACRLAGVEESVVTAESHDGSESGDFDALVCYYLGTANPRELRAHLEHVLDPYKVPSVLHRVEAFDYTRNGKVDHGALRAGRRRVVSGHDDTPVSQVLRFVRGATGVRDVNLEDNFFDVGGDSASTVALVGLLRSLGWNDVGVRDVLRAENLGALVARLPLRAG